jgi:hypothetical protein
MSDKIPVFDSWGSHIGDFTPVGTPGCLILLGGLFVLLFTCGPLMPFILPIVCLIASGVVWLIPSFNEDSKRVISILCLVGFVFWTGVLILLILSWA